MLSKLFATIVSLFLAVNTSVTSVSPANDVQSATETVLATREFSLEKRYAVPSVNEVMKKNILLNLAYLTGQVTRKEDISWDAVLAPSTYEFTLKPGATFAYHEDILPQYADTLALTTKSIFGPGQGYVSDGYLYGDGVCHLASLMNWAARDAGLEVYVPKDHRSVGPINEVPDEYGVSIYINPDNGVGERNNLYITNTKDQDVTFVFTHTPDHELELKVVEA